MHIIVTGPDASDVALVVGVKLSSQKLDDSERQLKANMASLRSPVGLLVTPQRIRLYQDRYLPSVEDSIAKVGDFDVNDTPRFRPTQNPQADSLDFERNVQSWLEGLSSESGLRGLPPEFRRAAQMYIVPALTQGIVRSGHPRPQIRGWEMPHVFVETNWVVALVAPIHLQMPAAVALREKRGTDS